ncbi:MAG: hypothetical protein JWN14_4037 [Chthonomonadales bacterium]|nr:hypothetical protein [Chthonomonadales bacterium]
MHLPSKPTLIGSLLLVFIALHTPLLADELTVPATPVVGVATQGDADSKASISIEMKSSIDTTTIELLPYTLTKKGDNTAQIKLETKTTVSVSLKAGTSSAVSIPFVMPSQKQPGDYSGEWKFKLPSQQDAEAKPISVTITVKPKTPTGSEDKKSVIRPSVPVTLTYALRADVRDPQRIDVQFLDKNGVGQSGVTLKAESDNPASVKVITEKEQTGEGGSASFYVQSQDKAGAAKVTISLGTQIETAKSLVISFTVQPAGNAMDISRILGTFAGYFVIMILISLGAEKLTDQVKSWYLSLHPEKKPDASMRTLFDIQTYKDLLDMDEGKVTRLWAILSIKQFAMRKNKATDPLKPEVYAIRRELEIVEARDNVEKAQQSLAAMEGTQKALDDAKTALDSVSQLPATGEAPPSDPLVQHLIDICTIDFERQRAESRWAWKWRGVALISGVLLAMMLNINSLDLLSPILSPEFRSAGGWSTTPPLRFLVGTMITGFGASLGASFWQDMLDALSIWKAKAQLNTLITNPASKP